MFIGSHHDVISIVSKGGSFISGSFSLLYFNLSPFLSLLLCTSRLSNKFIKIWIIFSMIFVLIVLAHTLIYILRISHLDITSLWDYWLLHILNILNRWLLIIVLGIVLLHTLVIVILLISKSYILLSHPALCRIIVFIRLLSLRSLNCWSIIIVLIIFLVF